jgi:hypothetical protein
VFDGDIINQSDIDNTKKSIIICAKLAEVARSLVWPVLREGS